MMLRSKSKIQVDFQEAFEEVKDEAKALFESVDRDGSGGVDFEEFTDFISTSADKMGRFSSILEAMHTSGKLEEDFAKIDINGDGMITWEEFLVFASTQSQDEALKSAGITDTGVDSELLNHIKLAQSNFSKISQLAAQYAA